MKRTSHIRIMARKLTVATMLFCMVFSAAFAHVLEPGWWDASVDDLKEAREQIRLFMENGQGDTVDGILDPEWKNSSDEELSSAIDQLDNVIGDSATATDVQVGDVIYFGHYEQDNNIENGREPIQWMILDLDENRALLLSVYGLDAKPYNTNFIAVNWKSSTVRKFLGNEFYDTAFSDLEKEAVIPVYITSDGVQTQDPASQDDGATEDAVFLLSVEEAKTYFHAEKASDERWYGENITTTPTAYAAAQGATSSSANNRNCYWWLRFSGVSQMEAPHISADGSFRTERVSSKLDTIRPSLWVDLNTLNWLDNKAKETDQGTVETVTYDNGDVYVGELLDGMRNGQGTMTYVNGIVYEGEWKEDERNGKGTLTLPGFAVYEGEWEDDKMNGHGILTSEDGTVYDGEWKDNQYHGQGTMLYPDGNSYVGEWREDSKTGLGTYTWKDGGVYTGEFKDDERNGQGTMEYEDGTVYEGEWKDGKWNGQGTMTYSNGGVYVGEWKDGKWDGQGTMTYPDGRVYVGEFKEYARNGQGTMTYEDGNVYEGEWKEDERCGHGTMTIPGIAVYEGEWKDDAMNGHGVLSLEDGTVLFDGEWKDGEYVEN